MPDTIEKMGLEAYLEATAKLHNGRGYSDLTDMLNLKVPKTEIARAFGISRDTLYSWLKKVKLEKLK